MDSFGNARCLIVRRDAEEQGVGCRQRQRARRSQTRHLEIHEHARGVVEEQRPDEIGALAGAGAEVFRALLVAGLPAAVGNRPRLVVPCRPGTFGSHYRTMSGLSQFTDDLRQLMDHLGAARATVLSQSFGSCSALAFAASAPYRVQQVLLCAPSYPRHEPANWRDMDLFYIIGGVIGRRAPSLLKAIVPYLMRSVMQNTAKYLQRHIANSRCPADIAVLSNPLLQ